jgi:Protein of unknown function (DUF1189)
MIAKKQIKQLAPDERINFFLKIHRSVVSPDFYATAAGFSGKTVFIFVVQLCLLTAAINGAAYTYYALDVNKGLPARISQMLPGMSLKNGVLDPGRRTPYYPSKTSVSNVLNVVFCVPGLFDEVADSSIVVDTAAGRTLGNSSREKVLLASRFLEIQSKSSTPVKLAYAKWIPGSEAIDFTKEGIKRFMVLDIAGVAFNFFLQSGAINTGVFCMSIMFLGFAACIFRIEKKKNIGRCFKMACFAVSPMFVGVNLIALSGTKFPMGWHLMLILSTVVLFRGINAERKALLKVDKID